MIHIRTITVSLLLVVTSICGHGFCARKIDNLVLQNGHVRLVFSSGQDFMFQEYSRGGTNWLPANGSNTWPWQLVLLGPRGETPVIKPAFTYYDGGTLSESGDTSRIDFRWRMLLDGKDTYAVTMTVSLENGSELPEWRISADLPDGWTVTSTEFPRIAVRRKDGAKGILPVGYGTEYAVGASGNLQARYPSCTGAMQLVLMHDDEHTAFFSARDKDGCDKTLQIKSEGSQAVFVQQVTASYGWTADNRFTLPWAVVLGFTDKNWQEAVTDWYEPFTFETEWGRKTIRDRKIAGWIKDADLWLRPMGTDDNTLNTLRSALDYYGKGVGLHWYYWHNYRFDTNYPEYFPEKPGFKDVVKEMKKKGAHTTPYINGRLWDPSTPSYTSLDGKSASCRKPDGTLYTELYSSKAVNTVTCPSSEIWQNVLRDLNSRILNELKTDGVYMDQIGAASSEPCYAENHPHSKGGGDWWHKAYRSLLTSMRKDLYRPGQAMTTEEDAECYIDLFDMMLLVNTTHNSYVRMVPLFPLVYSDRCVYSGFTYVPWRLNDGSFNYMTAKSLIWGSQLGWVDPVRIMAPENVREKEFLGKMAEFRKGNHDLFLGGRFLGEIEVMGDNPVTDVPGYQPTGAVIGAEWLSVDGKKARILVNMSGTGHKVILDGTTSVDVPAFSAIRL